MEISFDYTCEIARYIELETAVLKALDAPGISALMNAIDATRQNGASVYIMGNGGSAATASHFANDFNKGRAELLEKKFRFVCLNDNISTVTALANDYGYDMVFEYQLRGRLSANDLVIGISGSGNSENVINALRYAKSIGAATAALTGYDGGELRKIADLSVHVPVSSMQVTEDVHLILGHLMTAVFYKNHLPEGR